MTGPVTTWVALAGLLSLEDMVAVGDALVTGEPAWTSIEELGSAIVPGGRGASKLWRAVPLVRSGPLSRPEAHFRLQLVRAGLPEPRIAEPVWVSGLGLFLHPDLSWPTWRVAFEYEGDGHRTDIWQFRHDIERVEQLVDGGWSVSRFSADDIYRRPLATVARARRRLLAAGWVDSA